MPVKQSDCNGECLSWRCQCMSTFSLPSGCTNAQFKPLRKMCCEDSVHQWERWSLCRSRCRNVCQYSSCAEHTDCNSAICLPAGVLNSLSNACLPTTCTSDSDCTAGTDGQCALLYDGPTCPGLTMSCVYTDAECRRAEGCDNGLLCIADSNLPGGAACHENQPPA